MMNVLVGAAMNNELIELTKEIINDAFLKKLRSNHAHTYSNKR